MKDLTKKNEQGKVVCAIEDNCHCPKSGCEYFQGILNKLNFYETHYGSLSEKAKVKRELPSLPIISSPCCGWSFFRVGDFIGRPSYICDVPVLLLEAFLDWYENGSGSACLDEEGSDFTLVLSSSVYVIEEREETLLHSFPDISIPALAQSLVSEMEENLDEWSEFLPSIEPEEIAMHKQTILQLVEALKGREKK